MTQTTSTPVLEPIAGCSDDAEVSIRVALKEGWDTRAQLKRTEASLALVLGALTEFHEGAADYVMHRLSLELRRLAEAPATAAALLGCPVSDIDSHLLQAIAAHLYGSRDSAAWTATALDVVVLH